MFNFVKGLIMGENETTTEQGTTASPALDPENAAPLDSSERAELDAFRGVKSEQDAAERRVAERNAAQHDPIPRTEPEASAEADAELATEQRKALGADTA